MKFHHIFLIENHLNFLIIKIPNLFFSHQLLTTKVLRTIKEERQQNNTILDLSLNFEPLYRYQGSCLIPLL